MAPLRGDVGQYGEAGVSDIQARYCRMVRMGLVFSASSVAFTALTAAGTTTTGLTVYNPSGSGRNLAILDVEVAFTPVTLATVAVTAVLGAAAQTTAPTYGTSYTPVNNLFGSGIVSVATAGYGSSTITNSPTGLRIIGNCLLTVLTTSGGSTAAAALQKDEVAGAVIIPPGNLLTIFGVGTVADATSMQTVTWAELIP